MVEFYSALMYWYYVSGINICYLFFMMNGLKWVQNVLVFSTSVELDTSISVQWENKSIFSTACYVLASYVCKVYMQHSVKAVRGIGTTFRGYWFVSMETNFSLFRVSQHKFFFVSLSMTLNTPYLTLNPKITFCLNTHISRCCKATMRAHLNPASKPNITGQSQNITKSTIEIVGVHPNELPCKPKNSHKIALI